MRHLSRFFLSSILAAFFLTPLGHAAGADIKIVAFGTSFTAGKGVWPSEAFPAKLEKLLQSRGLAVQVSNQGVNGNTTVDLKNRLDAAVPAGVQIVIFEYAMGNDHRDGLKMKDTVENSEAIITRLLDRNIQVLLVIRGANQEALAQRTQRFRRIIHKYKLSYIEIEQPESSLLSDRQHPTAEAHELIAQSMMPPVLSLIERVKPVKP